MLKVAQCWDDGVYTDRRLTEILHKYNAKATFNLCPGRIPKNSHKPFWREAPYSGWSCRGFLGGQIGLSDLKEVYGDFEVASHCMEHNCAENEPPEQFLKGAIDGRKFLEDFFQKPCHGFAWPCGQYTQYTADKLLEAGFEYGRTTQNTKNVLRYRHPMILHSSCHFQNDAFFDLYEEAKKGDGVFYFWGHSYEMMDSEGMWQQLEAKIRHISEDTEACWINVVDIVRGNR